MAVKVTERKLGREKAWGKIWFEDNLIEIDPRIKGKNRFFTLLHEFLHHAFPNLPEAEIQRAEKLIGKGLWKYWAQELLKK